MTMFEAGTCYESTYEMPVDDGAATLHDSLVFYGAPPVSPYQQVGVGNPSNDRMLNVMVDHGGRVTWDETDLGTGEVIVAGVAYFHPDGGDVFDGVWESDPTDQTVIASGPWRLTKVGPAAGAAAMAG